VDAEVKTTSVHVVIEDKLLKRIDKAAKELGLTRSSYLRMAVTERMRKEEG
jgi:metal-responsive CopG/Arc/MetJ family transcriptional regulator